MWSPHLVAHCPAPNHFKVAIPISCRSMHRPIIPASSTCIAHLAPSHIICIVPHRKNLSNMRRLTSFGIVQHTSPHIICSAQHHVHRPTISTSPKMHRPALHRSASYASLNIFIWAWFVSYFWVCLIDSPFEFCVYAFVSSVPSTETLGSRPWAK